MKSRYVFVGIVVIALVLVSIGLLQVVSADYRINTTKTWVGGDGNWETAANWNPSGVPDVGDDVIINGGSVTISSPQSVTSLTFNGTLTGAGDLAISGLFTWSGGTMDGTGVTTANGGIDITTTNWKHLQRTLNNTSGNTATYVTGAVSFSIEAGGIFNNQPGATFNHQTDGTLVGDATFNNAGIFNRTTGAGTATISVPFNNTGTVNVNSGILTLQNNGTHTGTFNVADGKTLAFSGGTHLLNATTRIEGTGTTTFGTTVNVADTVTLGNAAISGGTVTIAGDVTATTLTLSSTLTGTGNLAISGLFTWSAGTMSGAGFTTANGGIDITTTNWKHLQRTLNNTSGHTATYVTGAVSFSIEAGGIFNNQAGATFNHQTDGTLVGDATFNNAGIFNRTTGAGTATISVPFNNTGTVNVNSGILTLQNNGTHTGTFNVADGKTLAFSGGTHLLNATTRIEGTGTTTFGTTVNVADTVTLGNAAISGGTVTIAGDVTATTLTLSSTLTGTGNLAISGLFTWSAGTMSGAGFTTANGGIDITTTNWKHLQRTLNNTSGHTATYVTGAVSFSIEAGGIFNNQAGATFNHQTDGALVGDATFNNAGIFNRTTGTGTATISVPFTNTGTVSVNSGTLSFAGAYIQTGTGSSIALDGGSLHISNLLSIPEGALKGSGDITGNVTIGAVGTVDIELGGTTPGINATDYDQLRITGAASLAGTLKVTLSAFTPAVGDTFTIIMTSGSCTGTFATANLPALGAGLAWGAVAYNSGSVVLSVVVNNPPTAVSDAYSTNEDTALIVAPSGVLANDSDAEGYSITAVKVSDPSHGAVTLNSNGSFTYTPEANYNGGDSFTYRAYDGTDYSSPVTVAITVNAVNDAPSFTKGPDQTVLEDAGLQTVNTWATGLSAGPSDESGQVLDFIVSNNNNSLFSAQPAIAANGTLTFTPAANANGTATVTVSIHDSGGISNGGVDTSGTQTFTVTVTSVNDPPVAADDAAYSTDENAELNQAAPGVLGNDTDIDGNPLTAVLVSNVSHGTLVLKADGSFTYTPAAGFTGSDSFTCKANDGTADSNVVTVTIEVTQPEPPTISSLDHLKAAPGETIRVVITGTKLGGATEVDFGPGVTVEGLTIDSASQITVDVKVASDAQSGSRDVTVTTPQGVATLTDAFTVKKAPSGGTPVWIWPVAALAVIAAGAGGFFLFFLLPRRKAKRS
jgi:VCBS repeat-containing protein